MALTLTDFHYPSVQDVMLEALGRKVAEVYRSYAGESGANLTTLQMLTNIEGRLGELLENVELVPKDRVLMAERAKEKERRLRWVIKSTVS